MGLFGKRPRRYDEMVTDPAFVYQVGRLIGAAEMAGYMLQRPEVDSQHVGEKLLVVVSWFFTPTGHTLVPSPDPEEQQTRVYSSSQSESKIPVT